MKSDTKSSWMPSVGDLIFILLLQLIFVFIPNFIFGDGSTGWHLVSGHYILDNLQIPRHDLISYTFPDKAWVAYEWLFDCFLALLDKIAGLKLVAVACCSAIATLFLLLYDDCRRQGCHFLPAMLLCIAGSLISAIHWLARPHLVVFFAVYFFFRFLRAFENKRISGKRLIICLSLSMLIWVNCHPSFVIGHAITVIFLFSQFAVFAFNTDPASRALSLSRIKTYAAALGLILVVTLINPYGFQLFIYIWDYLHQSVVLAQNDEFGSPIFHGQLQTTLLEILYFTMVTSFCLTKKKPSLACFLTVLAFAHLSLVSKRNMPLFVIVSLPVIAEAVAHMDFRFFLPGAQGESSYKEASWFQPLQKIWDRTKETMDDMEFKCTKHVLPVAAVLFLALSCFNGGRFFFGAEIVRSDFDPKNKPVQTLDCLLKHNLDEKRGLNYDNWGGYIRYKTGKRVFIDDRSDFYGENFYLEYADCSTGQPNWRDMLNKRQINWVLFPNNSVLAANLKHEAGWKLLCEDQASCLYVRER